MLTWLHAIDVFFQMTVRAEKIEPRVQVVIKIEQTKGKLQSRIGPQAS